MTCVSNRSFQGGSHAFNGLSYHIERRGASVVRGLVGASKAPQGSWMALHSGCCGEHRAPRGGPLDLDSCGLPGLVECSQRPGGDERLGGWAAQNTVRLGTSLERNVDMRTAQASAEALLGRGHRLPFVAVLRRAVSQPQRVVLRPAATRDQEVSCLCH